MTDRDKEHLAKEIVLEMIRTGKVGWYSERELVDTAKKNAEYITAYYKSIIENLPGD